VTDWVCAYSYLLSCRRKKYFQVRL